MNNVGTVCAALATVDVIQNVKPDLIISAGTCGGFGKMGAAIGNAYLTSECVNHARRIPLPGVHNKISNTRTHMYLQTLL